MRTTRCNFCGEEQYETRGVEYLYSHKGKYLLVSNVPVEICLGCKMNYYDAKVLREIENRFFDINQNDKKPHHYIEIPVELYG